MFRITLDKYTLSISDEFPHGYIHYQKAAKLVETFEGKAQEEPFCYLSVAKEVDAPFLIVVQRYLPGPESGFYPGILLIPETNVLFIGAGERLLIYKLDSPKKLWEEEIEIGFWGWARYQQFVIMSAEIELAVWDIHGKKLWSTFVEPPWNYTIDRDVLHLDVMGKTSAISLRSGLPAPS